MQQLRLFDPSKVNSNQFAPSKRVQVFARRYAREKGLDWSPPNNQLQVDPQRGVAQYQAYRDAQSGGKEAPGIRESFESMRTHVNDQFDYMTRSRKEGGMGFQVEFTDTDPYESPQAMADDVRQGRIKALKSSATGGHNYFSNEENDRFRAVHDVFGHVATGRGFSRHGEEAAWESHQQMFPSEARSALTSETRGQNSFLNFGGGDFPDQSPGTKLIGLPDWANKPGKLNLPQAGKASPGYRQEKLL